MLVVSRKVGERILVGEQIAITIVRLSPGSVRIGIDAPAELAIVREELASGSLAGDRAAEQQAQVRMTATCA